MKNFCALIGKYFGLLAVAFLVLGFMDPGLFRWVLGKVGSVSVLSLLLGVVMFGMGTTLSLKDFVLVFKRPKDVLLGAVAQFFIMPFLAYLLSRAFDLSPALTVGVVLVGTCPGGTSSNVITFMSKGDLALSVTMTSVSTVLSPILTPFITYLLIGEKIAFDPPDRHSSHLPWRGPPDLPAETCPCGNGLYTGCLCPCHQPNHRRCHRSQ